MIFIKFSVVSQNNWKRAEGDYYMAMPGSGGLLSLPPTVRFSMVKRSSSPSAEAPSVQTTARSNLMPLRFPGQAGAGICCARQNRKNGSNQKELSNEKINWQVQVGTQNHLLTGRSLVRWFMPSSHKERGPSLRSPSLLARPGTVLEMPEFPSVAPGRRTRISSLFRYTGTIMLSDSATSQLLAMFGFVKKFIEKALRELHWNQWTPCIYAIAESSERANVHPSTPAYSSSQHSASGKRSSQCQCHGSQVQSPRSNVHSTEAPKQINGRWLSHVQTVLHRLMSLLHHLPQT